ncbi:MAG: polysaccharide biosynthesis protein [Betaproteobacteria bacterium]|nr:polysaccharide biosynthesis protein [Betaproteobacteria bacterium]
MRAYLSALPRSAKRLLMLGMDIALIPAALVIALALEHGAQWPQVEGLGLTLALALLVAIPIFIKLGLYSAVIRYMEFRMSLTIVVSVTIAALLFAGVVDLLGISTLTVQDAVTYWMLALLGIGGSRVIARQYLRQSSASSAVPDPVIIYGAGDAGAQLAISLKSNPAVILVAFVDDKPDLTGSFLYGIRIHPAARLPALVKELGVRQVLLAMPSASKAQKREVFDRIEHVGVRIRTIPRLSALLDGRARISDIEDISIEELVGRDPVPPISALLARCIERKAVLVTGAGGSIGAELCRQILALAPKKLVLLDLSEYALYAIHEELAALKGKFAYSAEIVPVLGSVSRSHLVRRVLAEHGVNTIYHAAAYKHVPLLESNPLAGIRNNVIGSLRVAEAALAENVETFVLVSTDKAVRPANIMGASKRMAELVMQAIDGSGRTRFCMVRFGNVLDSSGSVVPLFRKQIHEGGPVTVTHPEITRYFMTIPEAAQLVLQAGAMAKGGDVFALDMGSPVKILDLARRMIRLSGFAVRDEEHPNGDIEIRFTGLRTGDKLYEELLIDNKASATEHPLIMRAMEESIPWAKLKPTLDSLEEAIGRLDEAKVVAILLSVVPLSSPTEPLDAAAADTGNRRSPPLKLVT